MGRQHAPQDRQPAAAREVHVEQHDVGEAFDDQLHRGASLVGLAHHLDGAAELCLHAGAEHGVVLDQEDAWASPARRRFAAGAHFTRSRRGMKSWTSAPSPGAERMTASPPKRATRAWIDSVMPRRSPGTVAGSKP